jgi:hypothetical protein
MAPQDLLTIAEAASALNLSDERVHQLLTSGQLDGVPLPMGRKRHAPGVPRVTAASVRRLREDRVRERDAAEAGRTARKAPVTTEKGAEDAAAHGSSAGGDVAAARAAAQELKVQMDALREELGAERARNAKLLQVTTNLVELLRDSVRSADALDAVADGYSQALTQLLSPGGPPDSE